MKKISKVSLVAMAMLTLAASKVQAAPVTIDMVYNNTMPYGSETITYKLNGTTGNVKAGLFAFNTSNISGTSPIELSANLLTFCVEITQNIKAGQNLNYTLMRLHELFGLEKADAISRLYTGYADQVTDTKGSAAFQLALWEIINDFKAGDWSSLNLTKGSFTTNSIKPAVSLANSWLGSLGGIENNYQMFGLTNQYSQNQLVFAGVPIPQQVSAPASLGILTLGLIALRLRRKQK